MHAIKGEEEIRIALPMLGIHTIGAGGGSIGLTKLGTNTYAGAAQLCRDVRTGFFSIVGHSVPLFLVNGNHEAELGWLLTGTNSPGVWGAQARQHYFPVPAPGGFYSGATSTDPYTLGPRDGYYAFEWGDALFVVIDPYWHSPFPVDNKAGTREHGKGNRQGRVRCSPESCQRNEKRNDAREERDTRKGTGCKR